jgi:hypothetical protein
VGDGGQLAVAAVVAFGFDVLKERLGGSAVVLPEAKQV